MTEPSENQVVPSANLLAGLTQLMATGGPFNALTLALYQNNLTPTPGNVLADFTIADYDGYANVAGVTFSSPYYDTDGTALAIGADAPFICTGSTTPNTIYGYLYVDAGVTTLKAAFQFANSVGIAKAGQACPVVPFLRYSGT